MSNYSNLDKFWVIFQYKKKTNIADTGLGGAHAPLGTSETPPNLVKFSMLNIG